MPNHPGYPWDIPVPVRSGGFYSVFPQHQPYNILVAWEQIGPFGARRYPVPQEDLLFVDQQTTPFIHVSGRLGSGRAGFYRGQYLKGIGRTPLAGNWNFSEVSHNTGHLASSSAIREYLISLYVKAAGAEGTIVSCEGVLLQPLSPELASVRTLLSEHFPEETLPDTDRHLQAITVKPGPFARISNFVWLLHHLTPRSVQDGRNSLSSFAQLLATEISRSSSDNPAPAALHEITPKTLVDQLERAIHRACQNFQLWLNLGIWWGSFGNNFTIDGRFLDLETPSVSGGPFLGQFSSEGVLSGRIRKSKVVGTEIFFYLLQMQRFCRLTVQSLSSLPPSFHPTERAFARTLAKEIGSRLLSPTSILNSRELAVELALNLFTMTSPSLSSAALSKLREIVESEYSWIMERGINSNSARIPHEVKALEITPILPEPGVRWRFQALCLTKDEAIMPTLEAQEHARGFHGLIDELDGTTDLKELLSKLANAERKVQLLAPARETFQPANLASRQ